MAPGPVFFEFLTIYTDTYYIGTYIMAITMKKCLHFANYFYFDDTNMTNDYADTTYVKYLSLFFYSSITTYSEKFKNRSGS